MNIRELINQAKETVLTPEKQEALLLRLKEAELHFEHESRKREVTQEFLNRTYTL